MDPLSPVLPCESSSILPVLSHTHTHAPPNLNVPSPFKSFLFSSLLCETDPPSKSSLHVTTSPPPSKSSPRLVPLRYPPQSSPGSRRRPTEIVSPWVSFALAPLNTRNVAPWNRWFHALCALVTVEPFTYTICLGLV